MYKSRNNRPDKRRDYDTALATIASNTFLSETTDLIKEGIMTLTPYYLAVAMSSGETTDLIKEGIMTYRLPYAIVEELVTKQQT